MSKKRALLIGVSQYAGLKELPGAVNDVKAMEDVLKDPQLGGFEQVDSLVNPDSVTMQKAIKQLFTNCAKSDLLLLFFSGHGVKNKSGELFYLTSRITDTDFEATAVPASFIHNQMKESPAIQQVVILDCCYSGAFAQNWQPKQVHEWALLASSTAARITVEAEKEAGIYTHYLVEGIRTGAADLDQNGHISVDELHEYAKEKIQTAKPEMKLDIQTVRQGYKITLTKALKKLEYGRTWRCIHTLTDHSAPINSVAISPDGITFASGSADKTIKIWNLQTGQLIYNLCEHTDAVNSLAINLDGTILASGSADKTIKTWNLKTGELLRTFKGSWLEYLDAINSVVFIPNSQILISGSQDHAIKLWNLQTGKELKKITAHAWGVYSVAAVPNGEAFAGDSKDNKIKLCSQYTGELLQTFSGHSDCVWAIAISPNGKILASSSEDKTIKLWDLSTGKLLHTLTNHSQSVHSVAFSPDSQALASGSYDDTIKLWNVNSGEMLCTLTGHSDGVKSVAFSPDGTILVSAGDDRKIKIWQ
jgi:WD40 repeat protein